MPCYRILRKRCAFDVSVLELCCIARTHGNARASPATVNAFRFDACQHIRSYLISTSSVSIFNSSAAWLVLPKQPFARFIKVWHLLQYRYWCELDNNYEPQISYR